VALAYSRGVLLLARLGMRRWSSADPPSNRARPGSSRQRNTAHARWDPPQRFTFFSFLRSSGRGQVSWTYALVRGCSGASQPGRVGRRHALVCGCRLVKKMRSRSLDLGPAAEIKPNIPLLPFWIRVIGCGSDGWECVPVLIKADLIWTVWCWSDGWDFSVPVRSREKC
jgi:hypothetical protein